MNIIRSWRMMLSIILAALLTITFSVVSRADESVQTEVATVTPSKLPKKKPVNIKLVNTITTFDNPATLQPPSATRTILDLPKQFKINNTKIPYCKTDVDGLQQQPTAEDAIKACGAKSLVSAKPPASRAVVTVGVPPSTQLFIDVDVLAFNEQGGKMLLYSKPIGSAAGLPASILIGKLKDADKVKGRPAGSKDLKLYKQSLDVSIPPLSAGAISLFKVVIPKSKYIQSKCNTGKLGFQATTFFTNHDPVFDTHVAQCKKK